MLHDESLPSDHAAVSVKVSLANVDVEYFLDRVYHLGERAVNLGMSLTNRECVKPIRVNMIDDKLFFTQLGQH